MGFGRGLSYQNVRNPPSRRIPPESPRRPQPLPKRGGKTFRPPKRRGGNAGPKTPVTTSCRFLKIKGQGQVRAQGPTNLNLPRGSALVLHMRCYAFGPAQLGNRAAWAITRSVRPLPPRYLAMRASLASLPSGANHRHARSAAFDPAKTSYFDLADLGGWRRYSPLPGLPQSTLY